MNELAAALAASRRVGIDIRRLHRAGHVHGQQDVASSRGTGDDHRRSGQADDEGRDRAEVEHRRHVAPPRRPARGDVGEQVQVREPDRIADCAGAGPTGRARSATGTRSRPSRSVGARKVMRSSSRACRGRARARRARALGGESEVADAEPAELRGDGGALGGGRRVEGRRGAVGRRCRRGASGPSRGRRGSARRRRRAPPRADR